MALRIKGLRESILFSIPKYVNLLVRKYHIKKITDLDICKKSAEISGLKSLVYNFFILFSLVYFNNGAIALNLTQHNKVVILYRIKGLTIRLMNYKFRITYLFSLLIILKFYQAFFGIKYINFSKFNKIRIYVYNIGWSL
jgi:hypothetical protein